MNVRQIVSIAAATLITTGALAIAAPGEGAHGGKGGHEMHGKRGPMHGMMAEKLGLSEAQKTQMQQMMETFRGENQSLMDAMKQTRTELRDARQANDTARAASLAATAEQKRADMQQRREAQHERMLQILTPEQRTQMQQMHEQMKERRGNAMKKDGAKKMQHGNHGGAAHL
jgi:Spy/CpxP family protein refolding chaperone